MSDTDCEPSAQTSRRLFMAAAMLGWAGSTEMARAALSGPGTEPATKGQAQLQQWFEGYVTALNKPNIEGLTQYYADEVMLHDQGETFDGRMSVIDHLRKAKAHVEEKVTLGSFVAAPAGDHILAELQSHLTARQNWPEMPGGAIAAGERREAVHFVMYDIRDKQFTRIRSARFSMRTGAAS